MTATAETLLQAMTRVSTAMHTCRDEEVEKLLSRALGDLRRVLAEIEREGVPGTEYRG
jgi:hypothetical protein